MDLIRFVFDRLSGSGCPDEAARTRIYDDCRAETAARHADSPDREKVLTDLEKVIRRQEMQALHEEGLDKPT